MLTVLISTRDRSTTLAQVLDAWERVKSPPGGYRLIVVDDGSRDPTPALLDEWSSRLPLTALQVPRGGQGQNAARNHALSFIQGDLVVFTDDDVFPRPDWLVRLREASDARPEVDVIVGTVRPRFEVPPAAWVLRSVRRVPSFAWVERAEDGLVDPTEGVGPSIAIRASRFAAGLRFDETIGPDGTPHYAMGSETELLLRVQREGARAWFVRHAIVEHLVTAAQIEEPVLLGRAYRHGRGQWRMRTSRLAGARIRLRGAPLAIVADLWARRIAYAWARLRGDPERALRSAWRLAYLAGHLAEIRKERGAATGLGILAGLLPTVVRLAASGAKAPSPSVAVSRRDASASPIAADAR